MQIGWMEKEQPKIEKMLERYLMEHLRTDAVLTVDNGAYILDYKDENDKPVQQSGGGVAIN